MHARTPCTGQFQFFIGWIMNYFQTCSDLLYFWKQEQDRFEYCIQQKNNVNNCKTKLYIIYRPSNVDVQNIIAQF